jgi:hypothetical protein
MGKEDSFAVSRTGSDIYVLDRRGTKRVFPAVPIERNGRDSPSVPDRNGKSRPFVPLPPVQSGTKEKKEPSPFLFSCGRRNRRDGLFMFQQVKQKR